MTSFSNNSSFDYAIQVLIGKLFTMQGLTTLTLGLKELHEIFVTRLLFDSTIENFTVLGASA